MTIHYTPFDFAHDAIGQGCYAIDLDGAVHAFKEDIRDALIARGVLHLDGDSIWRITWHGFDLKREAAIWLAVCDFCSERPVTWTVPCETFSLPILRVNDRVAPKTTSMGDWAACEPCGTFITENRRAQFLDRCLKIHGGPRVVRVAQKELHKRFWRHYRGGAFRIQAQTFGH